MLPVHVAIGIESDRKSVDFINKGLDHQKVRWLSNIAERKHQSVRIFHFRAPIENYQSCYIPLIMQIKSTDSMVT